jgi:ribose 5-phosphate isomerase B
LKVAVGCDHAGFMLKKDVLEVLNELGHEIVDCGTWSDKSVDYPDYGQAVAEQVVKGQVEFGIILCGTGIGISIAANKVPGIRAALCHDTFSARMSRAHNDANVLAMGSRVIGSGLAREIIHAFLATKFEGGRHALRVAKLEYRSN